MHPKTYCFLILLLFYQTDGHKEDTKKGEFIGFLSNFFKNMHFIGKDHTKSVLLGDDFYH